MISQPASSSAASEQILRRFYRCYKPLFACFQTTIQGIASTEERTSYAALLLNRLMFLYFLQHQGWLNGDSNYLYSSFEACQSLQEEDSFYRLFLLPLCQQLYSPSPCNIPFTTSSRFGTLPRFKLALFALHPLEQPTSPIHIPNSAFAPILAFFSAHRWQLGTCTPQAENALSPVVLSYVLEQQVNQKEMGVYYTKDDVTTYIVQNTLVPHLLQAVQAHISAHTPTILSNTPSSTTPASTPSPATLPNATPFTMAANIPSPPHTPSPTTLAAPVPLTLLPLLRQLLHACPDRYIQPSLQSKAYLPLETEADFKKRQTRYQQLRALLDTHALHDVDDLVTWHLDIPRLAYDIILTTDNPYLLLAFYTSLAQLSILDPTCGCGAFLLAALDVLEPLYAACLERIAAYVQAAQQGPSELYAAFQAILQDTSCANYPHYSILVAIIRNNLYGVDIMQNAAEICKQRLFLRLLQTLSPLATPSLETSETSIPPLDLDSHISTGNALLGAVHERELQEHGKAAHTNAFHWFRQFPAVMQRGGFAVILGNPPYVEYSKLKGEEQYGTTEHWGNVYAAVIARSLALCNASQSYLGLIVPLSICSSDRFAPLRQSLTTSTVSLWLANFEIFPCRIFDGAYQRLSILLAHCTTTKTAPSHQLYVTHLQRWYAAERPHLLPLLAYTRVEHTLRRSTFPKLASTLQERILFKVVQLAQGHCIADLLSPQPTAHLVYYQEATNNWLKAACAIPFYRKNGQVRIPPHGRLLFFDTEGAAHTIMAIMNSGLFYLWFAIYADGFHLSHALVRDFPLAPKLLSVAALPQLSLALEQDSRAHARLTTKNTKPARQQRTGDVIEFEAYYMAYSKPLIDQVDVVLARFYAFTDEELNFIIHYDLKYRMGKAYAGQ
jgi:hypothetical protein